MSEPQDRELTHLENGLRSLVPRPANIDRDQLMFEAGRASARLTPWWPVSTLGLGAVALALTMALIMQSTSEPIVQFVQVPVEVPAPPRVEPEAPAPAIAPPAVREETPGPKSYWRLHQTAAQLGVEQLLAPEPMASVPGPSTSPIPTVGTRNLAATLAVTGDY